LGVFLYRPRLRLSSCLGRFCVYGCYANLLFSAHFEKTAFVSNPTNILLYPATKGNNPDKLSLHFSGAGV
jgi:hypothetical protein